MTDTFEENRKHLNDLLERFRYWLHIEDEYIIYTIAAVKTSHKIYGDPIWLMIVGNTSDGKSEMLRAFAQEGEPTVDDLTTNTFVSGYKSKETDDIPNFAESLRRKIWYVFDMSILMSKQADERSNILSQMRMIYDGKLEKRYGNKVHITANTEGNTLICASTPAIDSTILEDQILGTRWIHYRTHTKDNLAVMRKIDESAEKIVAMRGSLRAKVSDFEHSIQIIEYPLSDQEKENIKTLTEQTRILRTSVELDRNKEVRNIAYPEGAGRLYKQLCKLYRAYRTLGLNEDEAIKGIRKICVDSITPVRLKVLKWLCEHNDLWAITSEIAQGVGIGKGHVKGELSTMTALGIVQYKGEYSDFQRRDVDSWLLAGGNFNLLLDLMKKKEEDVVQSNLLDDSKIIIS